MVPEALASTPTGALGQGSDPSSVRAGVEEQPQKKLHVHHDLATGRATPARALAWSPGLRVLGNVCFRSGIPALLLTPPPWKVIGITCHCPAPFLSREPARPLEWFKQARLLQYLEALVLVGGKPGRMKVSTFAPQGEGGIIQSYVEN